MSTCREITEAEKSAKYFKEQYSIKYNKNVRISSFLFHLHLRQKVLYQKVMFHLPNGMKLLALLHKQFCLLFEQHCYKVCYQRSVIDKCGCSDPLFPPPKIAVDSAQMKSCFLINSSQGRRSGKSVQANGIWCLRHWFQRTVIPFHKSDTQILHSRCFPSHFGDVCHEDTRTFIAFNFQHFNFHFILCFS